MNIKTETILVLISVVLGFVSTALFIASGLFKSPITDGLLILLFGLGVLFFTQKTGEEIVVKGGQVIFSITSILSVFYIVTRLELGQLALSGAFAVFTVGFLISAYYYTTDEEVLTEKRIKIFLVVLAVVFALVAVVDVVSGTPSAEVSLDENATVEEAEFRHKIGSLNIKNPSLLPQTYDEYPDYSTCLTGVESPDRSRGATSDTVSYNNEPDVVYGEDSADIMVAYPIDDIDEVTVKESSECPESTDKPTVHFLG